MTKVYFIRHCESDHSVRTDNIRPLTEKGLNDSKIITSFLADKEIDAIFSSPYKRAIDTVFDFSQSVNKQIELIDDFREKYKTTWLDDKDWVDFAQKQWADFSYKLSEPDDESLQEVQSRNIKALKSLLNSRQNQNIVIGIHGFALSTIINYYDSTYNYEDFMNMVYLLPWIVIMEFDDQTCLSIKKIDVKDI